MTMEKPPTRAPNPDLNDAELEELQGLLAQTPEPFEPLDVVMLDGFLCGVIVQPVLLESGTWLPHVFDFDAQPLPDDADPAWRARTTALVQRRHAALLRQIAEDGWFDPVVLEPDDWNPPRSDEPAASLNPISQALFPWVAGFQLALETFPDLIELPGDEVDFALARLYRHLPATSDEERELAATMDREYPLATLDEAVDDLIAVVVDLSDLTEKRRYQVETVRREAPKVGRNDPCPCGSGKKFKACHGKA
jgi:uncharacterized protein